jgi:hypothetical protein
VLTGIDVGATVVLSPPRELADGRRVAPKQDA